MTKHLVNRKYVQPRRMGDVVVDAFGKNPKKVRTQSRGEVYLEVLNEDQSPKLWGEACGVYR